MEEKGKRNTRVGIDKKLARYALAGSAILGAPIAAKADTIFYSGLLNDGIYFGSPTIDLPGGASINFNCCSFPGGPIPPDTHAIAVSVAGTNVNFVNSFGFPAALFSYSSPLITTGNATGPGGVLAGQGSYKSCPTCGYTFDYYGHWEGGPAYLGFSFQDGADYYTGWAQIVANVSILGGASGTLVDYAYNTTPGDSIIAGATGTVPEPSSLALFALGAAGIAALRKRRKAAN